jgi:hypothetical protein
MDMEKSAGLIETDVESRISKKTLVDEGGPEPFKRSVNFFDPITFSDLKAQGILHVWGRESLMTRNVDMGQRDFRGTISSPGKRKHGKNEKQCSQQ